ncbi:MAG: sigma-70 family RNA polymerase sigma factor [Thermoleophilia bacterium]|nr:sigma-70 family RNA polymerase sigma factor [Thermoleophilia bacterium]
MVDNGNAEMGLGVVHANGAFLNHGGSLTFLSDRQSSDGVVVRSVRYGCPEDIYDYDHDRLVQVLTILAGDRETAADAVQEAFARLVRDWDRVGAYEDPVAWVRRVALNQIRDHQRSLRRQTRLLLRIEQQPSVPEEMRLADPGLWSQVRGLPLQQRTAVALRYVGGLTMSEVAEAMHVSEGTVDQHLRRALRTLREALEEQP